MKITMTPKRDIREVTRVAIDMLGGPDTGALPTDAIAPDGSVTVRPTGAYWKMYLPQAIRVCSHIVYDEGAH